MTGEIKCGTYVPSLTKGFKAVALNMSVDRYLRSEQRSFGIAGEDLFCGKENEEIKH